VKGTGQAKISLFMVNGGVFPSPIIALTNSWQRVSVTGTRASGTGGDFEIEMYGGNTLDIWGGQLENGAYATSIIPTTSAAVTRLAEAAYKTSATSVLGQSEGTFFVEISNWQFQLDKVFIGLSDGSLSNYLQISSNGSTGDLQSVIFTAGAPSGLGTLTPTNGQTYKVAVAYKANDYAMYVNGVQIGTLTSKAAPSSLTRFDIFSLDWLSATVQPRSTLAQALLFKTRLTNAQLAELTTL
jgi:hypothetical protein